LKLKKIEHAFNFCFYSGLAALAGGGGKHAVADAAAGLRGAAQGEAVQLDGVKICVESSYGLSA